MKTYLNDYDLFIKAYETSEGFKKHVYEDASQTALDNQYYDEVMLDIEGITFHNHYYTFFCRLSNLKDFLYSLESIQKNYCILNNEDEFVLKRVLETFERFNSMNRNNKYYDSLEIWLETKAGYFVEKVEEYLHYYESDEYIESMIYDEFTSSQYEDYYILNNDFTKIYKDISYTETY